MKAYIEIEVPIYGKAKWMEALKLALPECGEGWQKGHFHFTMAFMSDCSESQCDNIKKTMTRLLAGKRLMSVAFGEVGAFSSKSGEHIINIKPKGECEELNSLINNVQVLTKASGATVDEFRLHVTLGRLPKEVMPLEEVEKRLSSVLVPSFNLCLSRINFRVYKGKMIRYWTLQ